MAIISVSEYEKSGKLALKKVRDFLIPRANFIRKFEVYTDTPSTVLYDVMTHPAIPRIYSPHPEWPGAICKEIGAPQGHDDDSYLFDVTCEYDDDFDGADKEEPTDKNPLNRPTQINGGFNEHDEIVRFDINGKPVRNSAKDPFDPPLTRKAGALRFSMTKNLASLSLGLLKAYKNAINSDPWFGQDPQTVRIANITFNREIEDVQMDKNTKVRWIYFPHTFEFELAETGFGTDGTWKKYLLDEGFRLNTGDGYQTIYDKGGLPVSKAVGLNGAGDFGDPNDPKTLSFDIYRPLPFNTLNLL